MPGLPARSALDATGLHLALVDIPPGDLSDPFLYETVQRLPRTPSVVHTPSDKLGQVGPGAAPAGVIFHMARCGSTLASQMLKQQGRVVVYSEPLAINELLTPPHTGPRARRIAALRTLGAFFASHAQGPYVLKLSSWNTLFGELIAEAFPATPMALCVRDPLEVAVSLTHSTPSWLREENANLFAEVIAGSKDAKSPQERSARFLRAFIDAMSRLPSAGGQLIRYEDLPGAVVDRVAAHFGLALDDSARHRMVLATQGHAKSKAGATSTFVPDSQRKRAAASAELSAMIDEMVRPAYQALLQRFSLADSR
jgi:hypothetical protein